MRQRNEDMDPLYKKELEQFTSYLSFEEESKRGKILRDETLPVNVRKKAGAELVEANLRLVPFIARRYENRGVAKDDLIGEGNEGLVYATTKYDGRTKFGTYAGRWVKQRIGRAIIEGTGPIHIPETTLLLAKKFTEEDIKKPIEVLAKEYDVKPGRIACALDAYAVLQRKTHSLTRQDTDGSKGYNADFEIPSREIDTLDESIESKRLLKKLPKRERKVIEMYYGFTPMPPVQRRPHRRNCKTGQLLEEHSVRREKATLENIGKKVGISREWVRRITIDVPPTLLESLNE